MARKTAHRRRGVPHPHPHTSSNEGGVTTGPEREADAERGRRSQGTATRKTRARNRHPSAAPDVPQHLPGAWRLSPSGLTPGATSSSHKSKSALAIGQVWFPPRLGPQQDGRKSVNPAMDSPPHPLSSPWSGGRFRGSAGIASLRTHRHCGRCAFNNAPAKCSERNGTSRRSATCLVGQTRAEWSMAHESQGFPNGVFRPRRFDPAPPACLA